MGSGAWLAACAAMLVPDAAGALAAGNMARAACKHAANPQKGGALYFGDVAFLPHEQCISQACNAMAGIGSLLKQQRARSPLRAHAQPKGRRAARQ